MYGNTVVGFGKDNTYHRISRRCASSNCRSGRNAHSWDFTHRTILGFTSVTLLLPGTETASAFSTRGVGSCAYGVFLLGRVALALAAVFSSSNDPDPHFDSRGANFEKPVGPSRESPSSVSFSFSASPSPSSSSLGIPSRSIQFSGRCVASKDFLHSFRRFFAPKPFPPSTPRTPRCVAAGCPIPPTFSFGSDGRLGRLRSFCFAGLDLFCVSVSVSVGFEPVPGVSATTTPLPTHSPLPPLPKQSPPVNPNSDAATTSATGVVLNKAARNFSSCKRKVVNVLYGQTVCRLIWEREHVPPSRSGLSDRDLAGG